MVLTEFSQKAPDVCFCMETRFHRNNNLMLNRILPETDFQFKMDKGISKNSTLGLLKRKDSYRNRFFCIFFQEQIDTIEL